MINPRASTGMANNEIMSIFKNMNTRELRPQLNYPTILHHSSCNLGLRSLYVEVQKGTFI